MESSRIFVKNLPHTVTEAEFRKHFSAGGRDITDIKLIPRRRIGYVGYKSPKDAAAAQAYFHRTFMRMSKLSVEIARPITDPSLPTARRFRHDQEEKSQEKEGKAKPDAVISEPKDTSKKRKRDDLDESNPKLKEYLEVMQPHHSTLEGAAMSMSMPADPNALREEEPAAVIAGMEAESDDEYETIPARPAKKPLLAQEDRAAGAVGAVGAAETEAVKDVSMQEAPSPQQPVAPLAEPAKVATGASDDDWLRSRTNRLLDLVDDLDAPRATAPAPTESAVEERPQPTAEEAEQEDRPQSSPARPKAPPQPNEHEKAVDQIRKTSRLFVRNLPYHTSEDSIRGHFEKFGEVEEVHLPTTGSSANKGYAMVLFSQPEPAIAAFQNADGQTFQGRILHVLPAMAKRDTTLDEFELSKLPLKKQNLIRKKAEAATNSLNWNSLFMSQDAVNAAVAERLGVSKSELLDPTSSDEAVKQAISETTVIQEAKAYLASNGVDLGAFKSQKRGDTVILVKNFPHETTIEELRKLFEEHGTVLRVLMPPSRTIAIVQFAQPTQGRLAFKHLAYRRIKDSVLLLEKGPKDLFADQQQELLQPETARSAGIQKKPAAELLEADDAQEAVDTTSLFVRNLNFETTTDQLAETFQPLEGFVSARVKMKKGNLSMGFGFVEFRTKEHAMAALKAMDGFVLHGHTLSVKASHRGLDAAEERRREDNAKKLAAKTTKIVIKNVPFEASKKDIRALLGTYGKLRSVRLPQRFGNSRGFAFADFVTAREAENALNALRDTHLLGRRLILDYAAEEDIDPEEAIAKMEKKIQGQVNKVALQQLTRGNRKKINIGGDDDDGDGEDGGEE